MGRRLAGETACPTNTIQSALRVACFLKKCRNSRFPPEGEISVMQWAAIPLGAAEDSRGARAFDPLPEVPPAVNPDGFPARGGPPGPSAPPPPHPTARATLVFRDPTD